MRTFYYEPDGSLGVSFPAGIKPKGAGTVAYSQKSLSINLHSATDKQRDLSFWAGYEFDTFSALVVRNGGRRTGARRAFATRSRAGLLKGMYLDNSATRPVVVYINSAYNSIYDLNEDRNGEFLETHYGINGDTVEFIAEIKRPSRVAARTSSACARLPGKRTLATTRCLRSFHQWIDVDYFTDYFIAQTYICNSDMFNQKYW
ncbi:MAG: hypothetical protein R2912_03585 [Eubacteriales bacterium]